MNRIAATALEQIAREYIEDVDLKGLKVKLAEGKVTLKNVRLRKDCLIGLDYPVDVEEGVAEEVYLNIPWKSLKKEAVAVHLCGVEFCVRIMDWRDACDVAKFQDIMKVFVRNTVEQIARRMQPSKGTPSLKDTILANVALTVTNITIHISTMTQTTLSLKAPSFTFQTCDSNWQPSFVISPVHRLARISGVTLHLNDAQCNPSPFTVTCHLEETKDYLLSSKISIHPENPVLLLSSSNLFELKGLMDTVLNFSDYSRWVKAKSYLGGNQRCFQTVVKTVILANRMQRRKRGTPAESFFEDYRTLLEKMEQKQKIFGGKRKMSVLRKMKSFYEMYLPLRWVVMAASFPAGSAAPDLNADHDRSCKLHDASIKLINPTLEITDLDATIQVATLDVTAKMGVTWVDAAFCGESIAVRHVKNNFRSKHINGSIVQDPINDTTPEFRISVHVGKTSGTWVGIPPLPPASFGPDNHFQGGSLPSMCVEAKISDVSIMGEKEDVDIAVPNGARIRYKNLNRGEEPIFEAVLGMFRGGLQSVLAVEGDGVVATLTSVSVKDISVALLDEGRRLATATAENTKLHFFKAIQADRLLIRTAGTVLCNVANKVVINFLDKTRWTAALGSASITYKQPLVDHIALHAARVYRDLSFPSTVPTVTPGITANLDEVIFTQPLHGVLRCTGITVKSQGGGIVNKILVEIVEAVGDGDDAMQSNKIAIKAIQGEVQYTTGYLGKIEGSVTCGEISAKVSVKQGTTTTTGQRPRLNSKRVSLVASVRRLSVKTAHNTELCCEAVYFNLHKTPCVMTTDLTCAKSYVTGPVTMSLMSLNPSRTRPHSEPLFSPLPEPPIAVSGPAKLDLIASMPLALQNPPHVTLTFKGNVYITAPGVGWTCGKMKLASCGLVWCSKDDPTVGHVVPQRLIFKQGFRYQKLPLRMARAELESNGSKTLFAFECTAECKKLIAAVDSEREGWLKTKAGSVLTVQSWVLSRFYKFWMRRTIISKRASRCRECFDVVSRSTVYRTLLVYWCEWRQNTRLGPLLSTTTVASKRTCVKVRGWIKITDVNTVAVREAKAAFESTTHTELSLSKHAKTPPNLDLRSKRVTVAKDHVIEGYETVHVYPTTVFLIQKNAVLTLRPVKLVLNNVRSLERCALGGGKISVHQETVVERNTTPSSLFGVFNALNITVTSAVRVDVATSFLKLTMGVEVRQAKDVLEVEWRNLNGSVRDDIRFSLEHGHARLEPGSKTGCLKSIVLLYNDFYELRTVKNGATLDGNHLEIPFCVRYRTGLLGTEWSSVLETQTWHGTLSRKGVRFNCNNIAANVTPHLANTFVTQPIVTICNLTGMLMRVANHPDPICSKPMDVVLKKPVVVFDFQTWKYPVFLRPHSSLSVVEVVKVAGHVIYIEVLREEGCFRIRLTSRYVFVNESDESISVKAWFGDTEPFRVEVPGKAVRCVPLRVIPTDTLSPGISVEISPESLKNKTSSVFLTPGSFGTLPSSPSTYLFCRCVQKLYQEISFSPVLTVCNRSPVVLSVYLGNGRDPVGLPVKKPVSVETVNASRGFEAVFEYNGVKSNVFKMEHQKTEAKQEVVFGTLPAKLFVEAVSGSKGVYMTIRAAAWVRNETEYRVKVGNGVEIEQSGLVLWNNDRIVIDETLPVWVRHSNNVTTIRPEWVVVNRTSEALWVRDDRECLLTPGDVFHPKAVQTSVSLTRSNWLPIDFTVGDHWVFLPTPVLTKVHTDRGSITIDLTTAHLDVENDTFHTISLNGVEIPQFSSGHCYPVNGVVSLQVMPCGEVFPVNISGRKSGYISQCEVEWKTVWASGRTRVIVSHVANGGKWRENTMEVTLTGNGSVALFLNREIGHAVFEGCETALQYNNGFFSAQIVAEAVSVTSNSVVVARGEGFRGKLTDFCVETPAKFYASSLQSHCDSLWIYATDFALQGFHQFFAEFAKFSSVAQSRPAPPSPSIKLDRILLSEIPVTLSYEPSGTSFTQSLKSVDKAHLSLRPLHVHDVETTLVQFLSILNTHYSQQSILELLSVAGSLDIVGNPLGLITDVQQGITDMLHEPLLGSAEEGITGFVEGVARGLGSAGRHTVGGAANTVRRFAKGVGCTAATLTMDGAYITRRRERGQEKVTGVVQGLVKGTKAIGSGISESTLGVVTTPLEGLRHAGLPGVAAGIVKGIISAPVKLATGAIDGVSSAAEGIHVTMLPCEQPNAHLRLPHVMVNSLISDYSNDSSAAYHLAQNLYPHDRHSMVLVLRTPNVFFTNTLIAVCDASWKGVVSSVLYTCIVDVVPSGESSLLLYLYKDDEEPLHIDVPEGQWHRVMGVLRRFLTRGVMEKAVVDGFVVETNEDMMDMAVPPQGSVWLGEWEGCRRKCGEQPETVNVEWVEEPPDTKALSMQEVRELEIFENQTSFGFGYSASFWTDRYGKTASKNKELPYPWTWATDWYLDSNTAASNEGWLYSYAATSSQWYRRPSMFTYNRRRKWARYGLMAQSVTH